MAFRRNSEPGRLAVTWLVTAFVVVAGAASCAFIIVAVADRPTKPLLIGASLFGGVVLMLGLMAVPREKQIAKNWIRFWLASRDKTDPNKVYRVGKKRSSAEMPLGANQPPTLDSVREAAEQAASVQWVPHGPPQERPPHRK